MSRTTDRTKLAAQWLPADVMRNKHHERECTYSRVIHYDDGSAEVDETCICDRLRACEERVLDAARERIMRLPYEIDGEILIDRDEVLAWIDALKEQK